KRVERRNRRDTGSAGEGGFPKLAHADTDRRDDSHSCDDHTRPHLPKILSVTLRLLLTGSAGISQPVAARDRRDELDKRDEVGIELVHVALFWPVSSVART